MQTGFANMLAAPKPADEQERLQALREYRILDTAPESAYDDIIAMASDLCGTPMAMLSLVDEARQWFKAKAGIVQSETDRDQAFCAHAILQRDIMVVPDACKDRRFMDNPLVTQSPGIRFYAGVPLVDPGGHALGTLCVADRKPRRLSARQRGGLQALSRLVLTNMELRRVSSHLADALSHVRTLQGLLPICMYCRQIRDDQGYWNRLEAYVAAHTHATFTHGICPDCVRKHFPEIALPPSGEGSA